MKKFLSLTFVLLLLLSLCACNGDQEPPASRTPAPNLFIFDENGNQVTLREFAGKPVVLNFWASWCEPCMAEMSGFQKAYETYGDQIHFVMVNMTDGDQETMETAMACINDGGYTFPVYFDTSSMAALIYGISTIPVTYFIDAQGNMVTYTDTALSQDALQQGIDMLLQE